MGQRKAVLTESLIHLNGWRVFEFRSSNIELNWINAPIQYQTLFSHSMLTIPTKFDWRVWFKCMCDKFNSDYCFINFDLIFSVDKFVFQSILPSTFLFILYFCVIINTQLPYLFSSFSMITSCVLICHTLNSYDYYCHFYWCDGAWDTAHCVNAIIVT